MGEFILSLPLFYLFYAKFTMLERPGDLIPVLPNATSIPWTRRRSQILNFLHRGPVTFLFSFVGNDLLFDLVDKFSCLFVAGDVKEHHHSTKNSIDDCKGSVKNWILLVFGNCSTHETCKHERKDD